MISFLLLSIPAGRNDREGQDEVWADVWGDGVDAGVVATIVSPSVHVCDRISDVHRTICARSAMDRAAGRLGRRACQVWAGQSLHLRVGSSGVLASLTILQRSVVTMIVSFST